MKKSLKIDKKYTNYFCLDEEKLTKLVQVLSDHGSSHKEFDTRVLVVVYRQDESYYSTEELKKVFEDDNITGKQIDKIRISLARKSEQGKMTINYDGPICSIVFDRNSSPQNKSNFPVNFTIQDDDRNWGYSLSRDIEIHIKRTFIKNRIIILLKKLGFYVPFVIMICPLIIFFNLYPQINVRIGELLISQILIGLTSLIIIFQIIRKLYGQLFQKITNQSVFCWGDQKNIYNKKKQTNSNILWGVVIAFLVSLAAGIVIYIFSQ